jgi:hypothetical protein
MRLNELPRIPASPDTAYAKALTLFVFDQIKAIAQKVNALADGRIAATDLTATSIPTSGTYVVGDFVKNIAPSELGAVSAKYVILGWINTTGGTPGTFKECRALTGN